MPFVCANPSSAVVKTVKICTHIPNLNCFFDSKQDY